MKFLLPSWENIFLQLGRKILIVKEEQGGTGKKRNKK